MIFLVLCPDFAFLAGFLLVADDYRRGAPMPRAGAGLVLVPFAVSSMARQ